MRPYLEAKQMFLEIKNLAFRPAPESSQGQTLNVQGAFGEPLHLPHPYLSRTLQGNVKFQNEQSFLYH
jgi:hypothetical protein